MYKGGNLIQMAEEKATEINLAVYMERLDSYIETQSALNNTLCARLEKVNEKIRTFYKRIKYSAILKFKFE